MSWVVLPSVLLGVLALLLFAAAVTDLRSRTISNGLNGAIALLAPLFWWASGLTPAEMGVQFALGLGVFGLFAAAFYFGWMGGGDVKLLGALALWLPLLWMARLLIVMAIAGGVLTAAMLALHKLRKPEQPLEIPYGVAIAFAGMWVITERYLNHSA